MSKDTNTRYHPLQISLHWLVVALLFAAFVLAKYMSGLPNEAGKIAPLGIHMTGGAITLIVVRFIARLRLPKPVSATIRAKRFLTRSDKWSTMRCTRSLF